MPGCTSDSCYWGKPQRDKATADLRTVGGNIQCTLTPQFLYITVPFEDNLEILVPTEPQLWLSCHGPHALGEGKR